MTFYPDRVYPESPDYPIGHDDVPLGDDLYQVIISYIPSLVASITPFLDYLGNIELGVTKGIYWDGTERIDLSGGEILFSALQVDTALVVDTPSVTVLTVTGDLIISNDLIITPTTGDLTVAGTVTQDYVDRELWTMTQATAPGDPADNNAVFWISDGTGGFGDAGDFCCKITEGGGTTNFTISDYSAL